MLQRGMPSDLILDLVADRLLAPGRIRHELLQALAVAAVQAPLDIGKVTRVFHRQLAAPVPIGVFTRIARSGAEAGPKTLPKCAQVFAQAAHGLLRQTPTIGVAKIAISGGN